jgi:hypothetical protein
MLKFTKYDLLSYDFAVFPRFIHTYIAICHAFVGSNGKRSKKSALADPNSFSLVDIEMCSNMDLKSDNFSSQSDSGAGGFKASTAKENHARKMSLKFIFVTPR